MMHAFNYVTPREYLEAMGDDPRSLARLEELARQDRQCENCHNPAWKLVGLGLCFSCVTGETDASQDYELKPEEGNATGTGVSPQ